MIRAVVVFIILTFLLSAVVGLIGWLGKFEVAIVIAVSLAVSALVWRADGGRASRRA